MNKKKLLLIYISIIIFPIIISVLFCYTIDLPISNTNVSYKSFWEILYHNLFISIVLIILTDIVALPILIINSLYLGLILGSMIKTTDITIVSFSIMHFPLELLGWVITMFLSYNFRLNLTKLIKKEEHSFINIIKSITFYLIPIYLFASVIENLEIVYKLKGLI
jgi:hypothetical protein